MAAINPVAILQMMQQDDQFKERMALQKEMQARLMEAEKRKMAIRDRKAEALRMSMAQQIAGYGKGGAFNYQNPEDVQSILQEADPQELNKAAMNMPAHQAQLMQAGPEGAQMAMSMAQGGAGGVGDTDMARYQELVRADYRQKNKGAEIPPNKLMEETMKYKRAQFEEVSRNEDAKNESDYMYHPLIQKAIAEVKAQTALGFAAPQAQATESGKLVGAENFKTYTDTVSAREQIGRIDGLLNHLETSDARTGLGAELFNAIDRAKALFGASGKKVSDTEYLDTLMGSEVFPLIKQLGIGARGLDTPAEREFLRKVMTGTIPLNKQTLIRMAELRRKESMNAVNKYNERVDSGQLDNFFMQNAIPKAKMVIEPYKSVVPTYTEDQAYEALKVLGPQATDEEVEAYLKQNTGGS